LSKEAAVEEEELAEKGIESVEAERAEELEEADALLQGACAKALSCSFELEVLCR
jgi:hypothetical protein